MGYSSKTQEIRINNVTKMSQLPLGGGNIISNTVTEDMYIASNAYIDTDGNWRREVAAEASLLEMVNGTLVFKTAATSTADSVISWTTAETIASSGAATFASIACTGNFAVNTNKFTVAAATGNTVVAGTLGCGAITSTGNFSAKKITGVVTSGEGMSLTGCAGEWTGRVQADTTAGTSYGLLVRGGTNSSDYALNISNATGTPLLTIKGDASATFAGAVSGITTLGCGAITSTGDLRINTAAAGTKKLSFGVTGGIEYHIFTYNDATGALTWSTDNSARTLALSGGPVTFAGNVTTQGGLIDASYATGISQIYVHRAQIHGDAADVGQISFRGRDSGGAPTNFAEIVGTCVLDNAGAETGSLSIKTCKNGSAITALTLDENQGATFAGDVYTTAWTDYSGTSPVTGWTSTTVKEIFYKKVGKLVYVYFNISGTSNATATNFTLPHANNASIVMFSSCRATDNGAIDNLPARVTMDKSGSQVDFVRNWGANSWTNSGTKSIEGHFVYEAA